MMITCGDNDNKGYLHAGPQGEQPDGDAGHDEDDEDDSDKGGLLNQLLCFVLMVTVLVHAGYYLLPWPAW